jgi:hypothetical protein
MQREHVISMLPHCLSYASELRRVFACERGLFMDTGLPVTVRIQLARLDSRLLHIRRLGLWRTSQHSERC